MKFFSYAAAEVPPIVATLTISPGTPHFITGMTLNVTCSVQIPKELISVPLEVTAQWTISGTVLQSDSRVVITEPVLVQPLLYQISLVISYLDKAEGDEGDYTCTVKINSPGLKEITVSASETIEIPSEQSSEVMGGLIIMWRGEQIRSSYYKCMRYTIYNLDFWRSNFCPPLAV